MTHNLAPTPFVSAEAARNAGIDLRVLDVLMTELQAFPRTEAGVLQRPQDAAHLMERINHWSAQGCLGLGIKPFGGGAA